MTPDEASAAEVRLERLRPAEIDAAMARAPVAWVPLGALEYHAPHLPNGTDGFTAHAVVARAASQVGGVVLPWSYVTLGTLALPWSFRYDVDTVAGVLRQTLRQLAAHGAQLAIVHTGHAPLDLIHAIKRVCAEVEGEALGLRAYGLCYLELNAALGTGLGSDWPVAVDHASTMETSWVAALEPSLVDTSALPEDPAATTVGVYGPNPRFTEDASRGAEQLAAAASLLGDRATSLLAGGQIDTYADLRALVERYWPEPLLLGARAGSDGDGAILVTNPGPVSRYLSSILVRVDGSEVPRQKLVLRNRTVGESGVSIRGDELGAERGFYVRRNQTAEITLPAVLTPGHHEVELVLGLAGVAERVLAGPVTAR